MDAGSDPSLHRRDAERLLYALRRRLESEDGASVKAAGWKCVGQAGGLRWTGKRRPEVDLYPAQMKLRFEITDEKGAAE